MRIVFAAALFLLPLGARAQTTTDPSGYAIVCNGYCTTAVPAEGGEGAVTVVLPQGYIAGRVDLPAGAYFPSTPGYEYKADPNNTLIVGAVTTP